MKIGIDCRLWNETGVGRYIRNLVFSLQKIDQENEYVLFFNKRIKNQELRIKGNSKWKIVITDIHWHSVAEQIAFPKLLYKENLDLMHFPYFSLPIFYNRPFVVTIHDLIINHFPTGKASTLPYPIYQLKRIAYSLVLRHAITKSKKIIVPLRAVKKDMIKTFHVPHERIRVTYEGVETMFFREKSSQPPLIKGEMWMAPLLKTGEYFLYVGNAYPHKNLAFLIDAFMQWKEKTPSKIKLLLVGKDDYFYQRLEKTVIRDDIKFLHHVDDEELFALYKHALAFVSASKMEGFGLPALEAMSASCPVLVSQIPAFREVCKNVAWYFDPYITKSLVEKMNEIAILSSEEKAKHIALGKNRLKDFSWEEMAKKTKRIYEEVA